MVFLHTYMYMYMAIEYKYMYLWVHSYPITHDAFEFRNICAYIFMSFFMLVWTEGRRILCFSQIDSINITCRLL